MQVKKSTISFCIFCVLFLLSIFTGANLTIFNYEAEVVALLSFFVFFEGIFAGRIFYRRSFTLLEFLFLLQVVFLGWQCLGNSTFEDKTTTFFIRHVMMLPLMFVAMKTEYIERLIAVCTKYIILIDLVYLAMWFVRGNNGSFINSYQYVAAYSSILVVFIFAKFFVSEAFDRKDTIIMILGLLTLIMTGKRSYIIILCVIFAIGVLFFKNRHKNQRMLKVVFPIVIIGGIAIGVVPELMNSFARFNELSGDATLSGRTKLWELANSIWQGNYWTGMGYGTFSTYISENLQYVYSNFGVQRTYATHNIYLQLLAETGIVGTIIFVSFFVFELVFCLKVLKKAYLLDVESSKYICTVALFLQIWFLLYGLSGNPLYMPGQFGLYLFAIMFTCSVRNELRTYDQYEL